LVGSSLPCLSSPPEPTTIQVRSAVLMQNAPLRFQPRSLCRDGNPGSDCAFDRRNQRPVGGTPPLPLAPLTSRLVPTFLGQTCEKRPGRIMPPGNSGTIATPPSLGWAPKRSVRTARNDRRAHERDGCLITITGYRGGFGSLRTATMQPQLQSVIVVNGQALYLFGRAGEGREIARPQGATHFKCLLGEEKHVADHAGIAWLH
jgi:hypothetical protein